MRNSDALSELRIPSNWGFCFAGNEAAFCRALQVAHETHETHKNGFFDYLEIGLGHGACLRAVSEFLEQFDGLDWRLVGVDLPLWTGNGNLPESLGRYYCGPASVEDAKLRPARTISLCLTGAQEFLRRTTQSFDFVFIDACHGKACVMADFYGAEPLVKPGGVVCFHDTSPGCQGMHYQPHCGTGIDARAAVEELGLLDDSRKGWEKLFETAGDQQKGGHGSLFVRKV